MVWRFFPVVKSQAISTSSSPPCWVPYSTSLVKSYESLGSVYIPLSR